MSKHVKYVSKSVKTDKGWVDTNYKEVETRKPRLFTSKDHSQGSINIFKLVMLILLAYSLISVLFGREPITFTAFLRMLQQAPDINMNFVLFKNTEIGGDWGIFEFMKSFVEMFLNLINVGAFAGNMLVQVVKFILYFLKWFFL